MGNVLRQPGTGMQQCAGFFLCLFDTLLKIVPMSVNKILISLLLCCYATCGYAQTNAKSAAELSKKAMAFENEGKYDEAIPLLEEAEKMDKTNYGYRYEIAYSYMQKKDYEKALEAMKTVMAMGCNREECYQMLGNIYDDKGDSSMALRTYADGIKKFPKAGRLYLETGNVYLERELYQKALEYYEMGIDAEPTFPSNYYRATQLYTSSTESVWGMIYGELFMNLERNTERTEIVSKWLYDTYKRQIVIGSKDSIEVHFCRTNVISAADLTPKKNKELVMPFGMTYEVLMSLSLVGIDTIGMESLCRVRKNFIGLYYDQSNQKKYRNLLFDYQHTLAGRDHMDAYSHWILMKGDEAGFEQWQKSHKKAWESFEEWFKDNPLMVDNDNKFVRP